MEGKLHTQIKNLQVLRKKPEKFFVSKMDFQNSQLIPLWITFRSFSLIGLV